MVTLSGHAMFCSDAVAARAGPRCCNEANVRAKHTELYARGHIVFIGVIRTSACTDKPLFDVIKMTSWFAFCDVTSRIRVSPRIWPTMTC